MGVLLNSEFSLEHPPLRSCAEVERERSCFVEYTTRHDAMQMLWSAMRATTDPRLQQIIYSAIGYLRETALDLIPYGATTPNKDSYGRRYGRW